MFVDKLINKINKTKYNYFTVSVLEWFLKAYVTPKSDAHDAENLKIYKIINITIYFCILKMKNSNFFI